MERLHLQSLPPNVRQPALARDHHRPLIRRLLDRQEPRKDIHDLRQRVLQAHGGPGDAMRQTVRQHVHGLHLRWARVLGLHQDARGDEGQTDQHVRVRIRLRGQLLQYRRQGRYE